MTIRMGKSLKTLSLSFKLFLNSFIYSNANNKKVKGNNIYIPASNASRLLPQA